MIGDLHCLVSFQDLLRLQPDDDDDHYYYKDPQIIKPTFFINSFKIGRVGRVGSCQSTAMGSAMDTAMGSVGSCWQLLEQSLTTSETCGSNPVGFEKTK